MTSPQHHHNITVPIILVLQRDWMGMMIDTYSNESDYWYYTGLIYHQFQGLMYGYNQAAPDSQVSIPIMVITKGSPS